MSLLDYWETQRPAVKRRKTSEEPRDYDEKMRANEPEAPPTLPVEIADTPASFEDAESQIPNSQTDLETSPPSIKTDEHAEEDEVSKTAEEEDAFEPGLHVRLRDGVWKKGRSSIYVDAFNLALETVLDEESHLFDEAEMEVFRQWKELSYESQYLYVF